MCKQEHGETSRGTEIRRYPEIFLHVYLHGGREILLRDTQQEFALPSREHNQ